jgi:hypothetical protein
VVEEKRPAVQVNLAELMKQTGIVDDDESFFMMDDEPVQPPAPLDQQIPLVETKENNVKSLIYLPSSFFVNLIFFFLLIA